MERQPSPLCPLKLTDQPKQIITQFFWVPNDFGLSVNQHTGKNTKYWQKLPDRVEKAISNKKIPRELTLILKELRQGKLYLKNQKLKENSDKTYIERLQACWEVKERFINFQLICILSSIPEKLLALVLKKLTMSKDIPDKYELFTLKGHSSISPQRQLGNLAQPDVLLKGNKHLVLIELKTHARSKNPTRYKLEQLIKYLSLVKDLKNYEKKNGKSQTRFLHLIIVPETDDNKWLVNSKVWISNIGPHGLLKFREEKCLSKARKRLRKYIHNSKQFNDLPVYYKSWNDLVKAYDDAVKDFDDKKNSDHWQKIGTALSELADRASKPEDDKS